MNQVDALARVLDHPIAWIVDYVDVVTGETVEPVRQARADQRFRGIRSVEIKAAYKQLRMRQGRTVREFVRLYRSAPERIVGIEVFDVQRVSFVADAHEQRPRTER